MAQQLCSNLVRSGRKQPYEPLIACAIFLFMKTPEYFMKIALKEAKKAKEEDEVPVGAVIVKDDCIIAKAHNLKETKQLATAHAEVLAIQKASRKLKTWNLQDCDLYVTLEPCMMCTGTIELARIRRLFYGTADPKGGCVKSLVNIKDISHLNTYPKEIITDVMHDECSEILTSFFKEKRRIKKLLRKVKNNDETC